MHDEPILPQKPLHVAPCGAGPDLLFTTQVPTLDPLSPNARLPGRGLPVSTGMDQFFRWTPDRRFGLVNGAPWESAEAQLPPEASP